MISIAAKKLVDLKIQGRSLFGIQCIIQLAYRKFPIDNTDFLDVEVKKKLCLMLLTAFVSRSFGNCEINAVV